MQNTNPAQRRCGIYLTVGRALAFLLMLLGVAGPASLADATTITGTVKLPDGSPVNGLIEFVLSQRAKTITPPVIYAPVKTTCAITNGVLATGCTVQGNDTLDPAGTFYRVRILDSNNRVIAASTNYTISGASVDISSLPITASATLQPPTGSVTGDMNVTGNLTVGGTATFGADPQDFTHLRLLSQAADPATQTSGSLFYRSDLDSVRVRASGIEIFDGAQYLPLTAATSNTFEFGANIRLPGVFAATFKRLNQIRLVDPNLWTESGVTAKIDAAEDDCVGTPCLVVLPSNLPAGDPTLANWDENTGILDLRQGQSPNEFGDLGNFFSPFVLRMRKTTDGNQVEHFGPLMTHLNHLSGGVNQTGGPKTTYWGFRAAHTSRGQGQSYLLGGTLAKFGAGDAQALEVAVSSWGGCLAGGDECAIGVRSAVRQQSTTFTATISSATDNGTTWTINYSSPTNENVRGEQRYLINTTPAKVYTTGSVSSISSATPPVVTFTGTALDTQFGTGAHTDLCFSQNDDDDGTSKYVVPISSVDSATQVTLNLLAQGAQKDWVGDNDGSNYRIYFCSQVTALADSGSLTVQEGYTNWQAGDTIEMPLHYAFWLEGARIAYEQRLPGVISSTGLRLNNTSPRSIRTAISVDGIHERGLNFGGTWAGSAAGGSGVTTGILFANAPSIGIQFADVPNQMIRQIDSTGTTGNFDFVYDSSADRFDLTHNASTSNQFNFFVAGGSAGLAIGTTWRARTAFETQDGGYLRVGTTAIASAGAIRLRNDEAIVARNNANTADITALNVNTSDEVELAQAGTRTVALGDFETAGTATFSGGINNDGASLKHARLSTGSIAAGSSAAITLTWTTAFLDSNYTANCLLVEATASTSTLRIHHIESVTAASVVIRVVNDDGTTAHTGTLHCLAVHD